MAVERRQVGWAFWRRWVLVTTLGAVLAVILRSVGLLTAIVAGFTVFSSQSPSLAAFFGIIAVAVVLGILGIALFGVAQRKALRPNISVTRRWILATTVGVLAGAGLLFYVYSILGLAKVMCNLIGEPDVVGIHSCGYAQWQLLLAGAVNGAALGILFGLSLGTAQWLALRRHLPRAQWYMLGSTVGGFVSFLWIGMGFLSGSGSSGVVAVTVGIVVGWFSYPAITGLTLVWLLRQPNNQT